MARRNVFDEGIGGMRGGDSSAKEQTAVGAAGSESDLAELIAACGKKKVEASELEARAFGAVAGIAGQTHLELSELRTMVGAVGSGVETILKWTGVADRRFSTQGKRDFTLFAFSLSPSRIGRQDRLAVWFLVATRHFLNRIALRPGRSLAI